jgi:hypothetical protein
MPIGPAINYIGDLTMNRPHLIDVTAGIYGETLASATRLELIAIVSAVALELESRHPYVMSRALEEIHGKITDASDADNLTLAIAAAIRLRLPDLEITPLQRAIASQIAA